MDTISGTLKHLCAHFVHGAEESTVFSYLEDFSESDWNDLFFHLEQHRLLNQFFETLPDRFLNSIPSEIKEKAVQRIKQYAFQGYLLSKELLGLLEVFSTFGIFALPFKGPILSTEIYGVPDQRTYSDLDLLISRKDVFKVHEALTKAGYEPEVDVAHRFFSNYLQLENFNTYHHTTKNVTLDVHWELTGLYGMKPIYLESISNPHLLKFMGTTVSTLPQPENIVYLCIHANSHCWSQLEYVVSLSRLLGKSGNDWHTLLEISEQKKAQTMVLVGMALAAKICHIRLPEDVQYSIAANRNIELAVDNIYRSFFDTRETGASSLSGRFNHFHFTLRDSLLDAVIYFFRLFFQPTLREWKIVKLPRVLSPIYLLIRPLSLGGAFLGSFLAGRGQD